ncbi:hypothetical protein DVH05_006175 [Phytophthora capsici]|nr:hypothetical protein DVH05_006175 [Phytophthora capsici]
MTRLTGWTCSSATCDISPKTSPSVGEGVRDGEFGGEVSDDIATPADGDLVDAAGIDDIEEKISIGAGDPTVSVRKENIALSVTKTKLK